MLGLLGQSASKPAFRNPPRLLEIFFFFLFIIVVSALSVHLSRFSYFLKDFIHISKYYFVYAHINTYCI